MTVNAFIVTQVGLDGATDSAHSGITLVLSTFKVGSGFGYTPTKLDTALHGTELYSAAISSFSTGSDGSLIANCTMSVEAGPFDFGEIGIYTAGGALFALLALPAQEHKYTSLGSTVASTFTFKAYLRLGQVGGIITIDTGSGGGGGGGTSNFVYTPQSGQPPGLWGSNDGGVNSFVWDPSNFNVNSALTAKNVVSTTNVHYDGTDHTWHAADGTTHLADLSAASVFTVVNVAITSDMRYKSNVDKIDDYEALRVLLGLTGITYDMEEFPGQRHCGIPAQELQALFPVGVTENEESGKLAVSYPQVMGALTPGAIRVLWKKMLDVERKLAALVE